MSERKRAMHEDVWERKYDSIEGPDGSSLWQTYEYQATLAYDRHNVWSVIEGDNERAYVVPGYHVVNMLGYAITRVPWTDADMNDNLFAIWW